ncbi:MAG: phosphomannomutase, partial [Pseudomonadales bacterium]|nr:phosphomannomutase [Pseudomonadales bacterium]
MSLNTSAFKAYDIRGRVPDELNEDIAFAIGRAYAQFLKPSEVVVGHDIRLSSPELTEALVKGLNASGVNVTHIGMCGTEEIYFATDHYGFDGGIVVTASHNPADYNGMKMVQKGARPISGDSGLIEIRDAVGANNFPHAPGGGRVNKLDHRGDYIEKLLGYVDLEKLSGMKVVANPGNGAAGPVVQSLMEKLPIDFVPVHFEADGTFPNGVPNPLIPENRPPTIDAIAKNDADLGVAWDGDFDRCFLFDENGRFIEGYYIVGLLAQAFLDKTPGSSIVHDPRLTWNTIDIVGEKGNAIQSKTGHAFIKERMRSEDAIY